MSTILLLLTAFSDSPAVTPEEIAAVEAREAANVEKFKRDKAKMDARASLLASSKADVQKLIAEKEAKVLAKQKFFADLKKYGHAGKPLTVKEKAKILYAKRNLKSEKTDGTHKVNPRRG